MTTTKAAPLLTLDFLFDVDTARSLATHCGRPMPWIAR
ncbi:hypothetical protein P3T36_004548 [Kitasatospora sp. MAP12-15]|nr:hypothetical protein [Kitasatospora sp. MAP12-44]